jgi:hypothetical protein
MPLIHGPHGFGLVTPMSGEPDGSLSDGLRVPYRSQQQYHHDNEPDCAMVVPKLIAHRIIGVTPQALSARKMPQ